MIHKNLNHPNIVKCYDIIKTNEFYYIVMEYCQYGDLLSYIKSKKKIEEEETAQILNQILKGYRYLM